MNERLMISKGLALIFGLSMATFAAIRPNEGKELMLGDAGLGEDYGADDMYVYGWRGGVRWCAGLVVGGTGGVVGGTGGGTRARRGGGDGRYGWSECIDRETE